MSPSPPAPYVDLEARYRRLALIDEAAAVLEWDKAAMMPAGGARARAEQQAALAVLRHDLATEPAVGDLLDAAEAEARADAAALDDWQAANLAEMRRRWRHATAIDAELVEALSRATSACEMHWRTARADDDFAALAPDLARVLDLVREAAAAKAAAFGCDPYDALLDRFEPGLRAARIDPLFDDLGAALPDLLERALAAQAARPEPLPLPGPFAESAQRELGHDMMAALGFDFDHGRLDVSHHPFTGGVPEDVRLTTRYEPGDFAKALMAVLHETGHALYEMGLPAAWRRQPVGEARGMALHESQSLLIEMQVCRGPHFLAFAAPRIAAAFGGEGPAWTVGNLGAHYRHIAPGPVRVDADEVTYPAHVILRYRLEKAMIAGDLTIPDLPGAWADGMQALLDLTPPDDRDGCLQDIHWPDGAFGYFPTYTLGALAAAQLYEAARAGHGGIPAAVAAGDFAPLLAWLRANVHALGSRFTTDEVLRRATGRPLGTESFKRHIETRYLG